MISCEQQERWANARSQRSLDPLSAGFGGGGLCAQLDGPGTGVMVLPANPLAQPIEFTDDLLTLVLPDQFGGTTANVVASLGHVTTTSSALIRYSPGREPAGWRGFVAVDRNGGVQAAIGTAARYQLDGRNSTPSAEVVLLFAIVHLVRTVVHTQARLSCWKASESPGAAVDGPFEILAAIPGTRGAMLGGLNEGWEQPEYAFDPPRALEKNVLIRLQIEEWPTDTDELEALALRMVDRTCEAFGDRQRRYLRANGRPEAGTVDRTYA